MKRVRYNPDAKHCIDCAFAKIDESHINRDIEGRPFMLACPFTKWKHFFKDEACDRFVQKSLTTK